MKPAKALVEPAALLTLVRRFEPAARNAPQLPQAIFAGGFLVPSMEDPGRRVLYLVANGPPSARADNGARWVEEHVAQIESVITSRRVTLCNVIFPGTWPPKAVRHRAAGTTVRLISAVHHLWADRLRVLDAQGDVDLAQRTALLEKLGGPWTAEEESSFTPPALKETRGPRAQEARKGLLDNHPGLVDGGVTVIYGPGGIGKTFFLRRVANRLSRAAAADPTLGIPVFAVLPLLLHGDVLETWISHRGIRLPITEIRALVELGVIVPVLDALDELVRGQAREGSRLFLRQLRKSAEPNGRALLSSRDYYLNLDPLVEDELAGPSTAELSMGFFGDRERRRYIQMRAELSEQDAARWTSRLEAQANETLGDLTESDVESLIGHPLFLDAFAKLIKDIPPERRAAELSKFRLTSPDVFGEIVDLVLDRERIKFTEAWLVKFGQHISGVWADPYAIDLQKRVLARLVLLVAADGAVETSRREESDAAYGQLRHGVFLFTRGVPTVDGDVRTALKELIRGELGDPDVIDVKSAEEEEKVREHALDDLVEFYRHHTLADTRAELPKDLVFAPRHRAYFDFILAEQLLNELQRTLSRADERGGTSFIDWCLRHHIFEQESESEGPPFASCLDFVLWHRTALKEALGVVERLFEAGASLDSDAASYVFSLTLAVLLRAKLRAGDSLVERRDFSGNESLRVHVFDNIVPSIAGLKMSHCSFPDVVLDDVVVMDCDVMESSIHRLEVRNSTWNRVRLDHVAIQGVQLDGNCHFTECLFDLDDSEPVSVALGPSPKLVFQSCRVDPQLMRQLQELERLRPGTVELKSCVELVRPATEQFSPGRAFVNRLMRLVRKHGHREYGVYSAKLRGLTTATGMTFPRAIAVLRSRGAVGEDGDMIYLLPEAETHMYVGKVGNGMRTYKEVEEYWGPIVAELDGILK